MADTRLDQVVLTIDGRPLPPRLYARLLLVRVEESVQLPDAFEVRFDDAHFSLFDEDLFTIGTRVQIALRADRDPVVVTFGEVTALALDQGLGGRHELVLSGFDLTHRLAKVPKSRSFQRMTDGDIARQIAAEYSLEAEVDSGGAAVDHVLQAAETDLAFLRRRAARTGCDVWVAGQTLYVQKSPRAAGLHRR